MQKYCVAWGRTTDAILEAMAIFTKHGVKVVSVTDAGWITFPHTFLEDRFHVFGMADEESQVLAVEKAIEQHNNAQNDLTVSGRKCMVFKKGSYGD